MRTLFILTLASLFAFSTYSCSSNNGNDFFYEDHDTYPVAFEITNVNFQFIDGMWEISREFNTPLFNADVVLIYRRVGALGNGAPIWEQIPITIHLGDGDEVDYFFDFTRFDFAIFCDGTFDLTGSGFVNNQTFRIIAVPASWGKSANLDTSNYQSVIDYYQIDDSNLTQL